MFYAFCSSSKQDNSSSERSKRAAVTKVEGNAHAQSIKAQSNEDEN